MRYINLLLTLTLTFALYIFVVMLPPIRQMAPSFVFSTCLSVCADVRVRLYGRAHTEAFPTGLPSFSSFVFLPCIFTLITSPAS